MYFNDRSLFAPDGTRIAYGVVGSGPPLLLSNGLTTSTSFWKYVRPMWKERFTVITWDFPGHGASDPARTRHGATIWAWPEIMARILDALGLERAVHIGWSVGSQVVLEMARQYPERVSALATLFGPAGHALDSTNLPVSGKLLQRVFSYSQAARVAALVKHVVKLPLAPGVMDLLRRARLIGLQTSEKDLREILDQLALVDAATAPTMILSSQQHSAYDVLPTLRVPLLIMAAARDPFMPVERVAIPMHEAASGSELVILPEATHAALLDFPDEIAKHVEAFLDRRLLRASSETAVDRP